MKETQRRVAIGVRKKGESKFKINVDPEPAHLIQHNPGTKRCSTCGMPVNIPAGTCFTCPHCLAQHGGCG